MTVRLGFCAILAGTVLLGQDSKSDSCPMHEQHMKKAADHHGDVESRGDLTMGFSHQKTTHHFRLSTAGGYIEVEANDPKDAASIDQIRSHLASIAGMFSSGNFESPVIIHAQTPPGVPVMKRLQTEIKYLFESMERGGRVRIVTANAEALTAVHAFLRFQITDHNTGDSLEHPQ